jgi:hypothetical protein
LLPRKDPLSPSRVEIEAYTASTGGFMETHLKEASREFFRKQVEELDQQREVAVNMARHYRAMAMLQEEQAERIAEQRKKVQALADEWSA